MPDAICRIDECDRPVLARGWCSAHYQRWKIYGDPLLGGPFRKPRRERTDCSVPECDRESRTMDLCPLHYQRQRLYGSTEQPRSTRTCSVDGCESRFFSTDFCRLHWTRWKEFGDPLIYRQCVIDGCIRYAPSGKRGWCLMHYTRWSKHGDAGAAAPLVWQPPREPADGCLWCTTCHEELPLVVFWADRTTANGRSRVCRECRIDRRTADYYGITAADYRKLLVEQGGVCRICGKPETATHQAGSLRRLAVDHDHKCCPGKTSCGRCIRGLLCARCNSAIGLFDEDSEVLLAAVRYLSLPRRGAVA